MATGAAAVRTTAKGNNFNPASWLTPVIYLDTSKAAITSVPLNGTGASLSVAGSTVTVSGATGITTAHGGATITLSGYSNPGNNGTFTLVTGASGGGTFENAAAVTEAGSVAKSWALTGGVTNVVDLVTGNNFVATGTATQRMNLNTSMNAAGKAVLAVTSSNGSTRWVTMDSTATAGLLNGAAPTSFYCYFRRVGAWPGSQWCPLNFANLLVNAGSPSDRVSFGVGTSATLARNVGRVGTGAPAGSQSVNTTTGNFPQDTWHSLGGEYNGVSSVDWYVDGAYTVTAAMAGTASAGVANLRSITIGITQAINTPLAASGLGMLAGLGCWIGTLGASKQAQLHAYFSSWQP